MKIASLRFKNCIVMSAMGCSLAESSGEAGPRVIKHYAERAKGDTARPGQIFDALHSGHDRVFVYGA